MTEPVTPTEQTPLPQVAVKKSKHSFRVSSMDKLSLPIRQFVAPVRKNISEHPITYCLLISALFASLYTISEHFHANREERLIQDNKVYQDRYFHLAERTITVNGPQESAIRFIIKVHMLSKGLPIKYWRDVRGLFNYESHDTQFMGNGNVARDARGSSMETVGIGQHYVKKGTHYKNGYDIYTLEGNVGATITQLKVALDRYHSWDKALNSYNGCDLVKGAYAHYVKKIAENWKDQEL